MLRYLALFIIALSMMISACQPIHKTEYTYIPPASKPDKLCASRCVSAKRSCKYICRMKNPACFIRADQKAKYRFIAYQLEMQQKGKSVTKKIKDFRDDYSCLSACNCTLSFNTCYLACGGQVIER